MAAIKKTCNYCGAELDSGTVALNKKLFGKRTKIYRCLKCMAEDLQTTEEQLELKIQQFKEEGCELFL